MKQTLRKALIKVDPMKIQTSSTDHDKKTESASDDDFDETSRRLVRGCGDRFRGAAVLAKF
jgi:hypothetical protein